jgi:hypothetical protein
MGRAASQIRNLASHLIFYESGDDNASQPTAPAAFFIIEKLRPNLVTLMGNGGFSLLLSRALTLAKRQVSWLGMLSVNASGDLEGLAEALAQIDRDTFLKGRVALLAQSLGVLVDSIGEDMTLSVVHDIWPSASLRDWDQPGKGIKNEASRNPG